MQTRQLTRLLLCCRSLRADNEVAGVGSSLFTASVTSMCDQVDFERRSWLPGMCQVEADGYKFTIRDSRFVIRDCSCQNQGCSLRFRQADVVLRAKSSMSVDFIRVFTISSLASSIQRPGAAYTISRANREIGRWICIENKLLLLHLGCFSPRASLLLVVGSTKLWRHKRES